MQIQKHHLTEHVKLLQKVALCHRDTVLILKRATDSGSRPGLWDLPGGNAEWPESVSGDDMKNPHLKDIVREVQEETGIELDRRLLENELPIYFGTYLEAGHGIYSVIVGWQVKLKESFDPASIALSDEHTQHAWLNPADFDEYDFGFAGEVGGFLREIVKSNERINDWKRRRITR